MKIYNNEKQIKEKNNNGNNNIQENNLMMIKSMNFSLISAINNKFKFVFINYKYIIK